MAGIFETSTWSVQKDWDQAELFFEIPNFPAVRMNTISGQAVTSKQILIGRSRFSVRVYPSGQSISAAALGMVGVFLQNEGNHSVVVDYTAAAGEKIYPAQDTKIESQNAQGWTDFLNNLEVQNITSSSPQGSLVLSMDIKLKKEEINGPIGEAVNKSFISIKEVEDGVENVMENRLRGHAAEVRNHVLGSEGRLNDKISKVGDAAEGVEEEVKQVEKRLKTEMEGHNEEVRGCFRNTEAGLRNEMVDVRGAVEDLEGKMEEVGRELKVEIRKVKAPVTDFIPACLVCLDTLETLKIVQCMQGHKVCEPCSEKEDVVACPDCKLAFLGRDMGMEACVQDMTEGSPARKKEDLIMGKIKIVAEDLKADVKNVEVKLQEDFIKEARSIESNLKAEVTRVNTVAEELKAAVENVKVKVNTATEDLMEMITNREVKLKADFVEEINNVQKNLKAEIVKVKTPAADFIPECPICLHQMMPPTKIVHCVKGHKLCETCSKKEAVKSCPSCKTAFMGRDFGMEAFIRELAGEK